MREYETELWNSLKQGISFGQLKRLSASQEGLCCGLILRSKLGDVKLM